MSGIVVVVVDDVVVVVVVAVVVVVVAAVGFSHLFFSQTESNLSKRLSFCHHCFFLFLDFLNLVGRSRRICLRAKGVRYFAFYHKP